MAFLTDAEAQMVVDMLQHDPIAQARSKHHTATYRLACAGDQLFITADKGSVSWARQEREADISIEGTAEQWKVILNGLHGGLHRAWRYKLLNFSGDTVLMMFLWKFMWRMSDALVIIKKGS